MILLSLALGGCHVFEVVEIVCASDEACASGDADTDADADTDTDTDVDTDTDTDTGPVVTPVRGWVISGSASSGGRVVAFNAQGAQIAAWTDLGDATGPVAYDPATGAAFLAYDRALYQLSADDERKRAAVEFPDVLSLVAADDHVYMATGDGLVAWNALDESVSEAAFDPAVNGLVGVGLGPSGIVFATDTNFGAPDLYEWDGGTGLTRRYEDYDGSAARARMVFAGPEEAPYTCSEAGAFYSVADLAAGGSRPVVTYSGGLTDVSACAYDPGDETWLLFSPSAGVLRLDAQGRAETVLAPGSTYTLVRGGFF